MSSLSPEKCSGRRIFLPGLRPGKKHRMFIRCEKVDKSILISKLNVCFCPLFPAVLNCCEKLRKNTDFLSGLLKEVCFTYGYRGDTEDDEYSGMR